MIIIIRSDYCTIDGAGIVPYKVTKYPRTKAIKSVMMLCQGQGKHRDGLRVSIRVQHSHQTQISPPESHHHFVIFRNHMMLWSNSISACCDRRRCCSHVVSKKRSKSSSRTLRTVMNVFYIVYDIKYFEKLDNPTLYCFIIAAYVWQLNEAFNIFNKINIFLLSTAK